jgi:hypothetical protein
MDGGREYNDNSLHDFARSEGINLKITTPHNSELNGRAEVSNHIICTTARKLMLQGKLSKGLWPYALECAVYLHNITPSDALRGKSPYQVLAESEGWTPTVPYLGHLKAFGCAAVVLNHDIKRGEKFTPRGLTGQLVGYESVNIYKIWIPSLHKVVRSTNVTFDETSIGAASPEAENDPPELIEVDLAYPHTSSGGEGVFEEVFETNEPLPSLTGPEPESPLPSGSDDAFDDQIPVVGSTTGPAPLPAELAPTALALADHTTPTEPRRSQRTRQPTLKAREADAYMTSTVLPPKVHFAFTAAIETSEVKTPKSFTEATSSPQAKDWLKACQTEVDSLRKNEVWELVKLPEGATTVKGK